MALNNGRDPASSSAMLECNQGPERGRHPRAQCDQRRPTSFRDMKWLVENQPHLELPSR